MTLEKIVHYIVKNRIANWEDFHNPTVRSRYGALEGWTSIIVNFVLFGLKLAFGILTGAVSLVADAFHSLSDVSTSVVILISFKISKKPSDSLHPFGHGRMEAVASVVVAVLLLVAGVEIFKSSIEQILHPKPFEASWLAMGIIAGTVIVKELLARFSGILGEMIDSLALKADFWHHRTDAISSVLVIAAFLGQRFGITFLDGVVGVVVALLIGYTGWTIARKAIDDLLGTHPSKSLVSQVKETARSFSDVIDVHDLIIHQYGPTMVLSFHIEVSESLSLKYAHALAETVEKAVNDKFHTYATVHLDPVNIDDPELIQIHDFLKIQFEASNKNCTFHDLRSVGEDGAKNILFDLNVAPRMKEKDLDEFKSNLQKSLTDAFPSVVGVCIEVEPRYVQ